ncbi:hypothetical protein DFQ28_005425, partial [Apophysomyces sp. BC1034]
MEIIGYARKSKATTEDDKDRVRLLQLMVKRLKERSHVQRTYIALSCDNEEPLSTRDMPQPTTIHQIEGIDGTMQ